MTDQKTRDRLILCKSERENLFTSSNHIVSLIFFKLNLSQVKNEIVEMSIYNYDTSL